MAEKPKTTPRAAGSSNIAALSTRPKQLPPLLDEFAMAALTGALANANVMAITVLQARKVAEGCYNLAEAMMEEREKLAK